METENEKGPASRALFRETGSAGDLGDADAVGLVRVDIAVSVTFGGFGSALFSFSSRIHSAAKRVESDAWVKVSKRSIEVNDAVVGFDQVVRVELRQRTSGTRKALGVRLAAPAHDSGRRGLACS